MTNIRNNQYIRIASDRGISQRFNNRFLRNFSLLFVFALLFVVQSVPVAAAPPTGSKNHPDKEKTASIINMNDVDINVLIKTVSEVCNKNFIVDKRVGGKVTVIAKHPMNPEETYRVFLSILQVHGYDAIPTGEVIKIVASGNARSSAAPVQNAHDKGALDEFITQVIPIKNVAAAQLVPILRPLVPQTSHLGAYPPTNVLIISDHAGNINRILDIVSRIDTANSSDVEIVRLDFASASDVARILGVIYKKQQNDPMSAKLTVAVDDRTNSILLNGDPTSRIKARAIIAHLDTDLGGEGGSTQVIYLKYANAKEMVTVLTGISDSLKTSSTSSSSSSSKRRTSKSRRRTTSSSSSTEQKVSIQADEATNALVITAPPKILNSLKTVIAQLDIRRAQVLVEAIIVEVSADKSSELGVNWLMDGASRNSSQDGYAATSNFGGILSSMLSLSQGTGSIPGGFTVGIGDFRNGRTRFGAIVTALASNSASNILSTPTIMTTDNEAAEIRVAENVPFVTGQYSNSGSSSSVSPFQTIKREDVGLILKVKPQINEGNAIKLDIEQEMSSLSTSAANAVDITTKKRSIKTSLIVEDGQVIVIGGLIDDTVDDTEQKVPGLGDLPLVGDMFKYTKTSKMKRNLMIFIHPTIIRDTATSLAYTHKKYDYIRAKQLERREKGTYRMSDEIQTPLLPKFEELVKLPAPFKEMEQASAKSINKESKQEKTEE